MNKTHTLKELADMFAYERRKALANGQSIEGARMLALKHVLDAIGYEFPKDEEREAFDAWANANHKLATTDHLRLMFPAWKAGREELRRAINKPSYSTPEQIEESIQNLTTKEPAWIPWPGSDKSPIVGRQTRYQIEYRDGAKTICTHNSLRWSHNGTFGDIIAYRILEP